MKKILYVILIALASVTVNAKSSDNNNTYYTNNIGIEITENQYNNLKGLGYTDNQIAKMDWQTFNKYKNVNATIADQTVNHYVKVSYLKNGIETTKYEVVTEKEFNGRLINPGAYLQRVSGNYYTGMIANDSLAVVSTISNIDEDYMQYRVDVYNYDIPTTRSFDIYGIGIDNDKVHVASAVECKQSWEYTSGSSDYSLGCYPKTQATGGSAMFELPTGSLSSLETYISFYVAKLPNVGTVHSLQAVGDYAHAVSSVSNSVYYHYTVDISGVGVYSPYAASYDTFNTPSPAGFIGTW